MIEEDQQANLSFEDYAHQNGETWWWASDLMKMLGYESWETFEKVINNAIKACMNIPNVKHYDHFKAQARDEEIYSGQDFKLTRFGLFLTSMNGDSNLPQVANAQYYFIKKAEEFDIHLQEQEVERLGIRAELSDGMNSLSSSFKKQGGFDYAKFYSAGFQGMYNQHTSQLASKRKVDPKKLYEFMGKTELAGNLFRVTLTEEKIKKNTISGQQNLEQVHYQTGKKVREMIVDATGAPPEKLPQARQLPEVKKDLKLTEKNLKKLDPS